MSVTRTADFDDALPDISLRILSASPSVGGAGGVGVCEVRVLIGQGALIPHDAGSGADASDSFPWALALAAHQIGRS